MPHGVHNSRQTAFRLPEGLLAWLREHAEREGRTMTEIVTEALEAYRDRLSGITTRITTGPSRNNREAAPPVARFVAAEDEQPQPAGRNCKHRNMKLGKGVCPDCNEWVTR
jgi:hypothetical protein